MAAQLAGLVYSLAAEVACQWAALEYPLNRCPILHFRHPYR